MLIFNYVSFGTNYILNIICFISMDFFFLHVWMVFSMAECRMQAIFMIFLIFRIHNSNTQLPLRSYSLRPNAGLVSHSCSYTAAAYPNLFLLNIWHLQAGLQQAVWSYQHYYFCNQARQGCQHFFYFMGAYKKGRIFCLNVH